MAGYYYRGMGRPTHVLDLKKTGEPPVPRVLMLVSAEFVLQISLKRVKVPSNIRRVSHTNLDVVLSSKSGILIDRLTLKKCGSNTIERFIVSDRLVKKIDYGAVKLSQ